MSNVYARKCEPSRTSAANATTGADVEDAPTLELVAISAKSLDAGQQARVRRALEELSAVHRPQRELARRLGVTQQTVSRALSDGTIGVKLAAACARLRRQSLEEMLSGAPTMRRFRELEGWAAAVASAEKERWVSPGVARAVGDWPLVVAIERAEPRLVADLAALFVRWATREERDAAERDSAPPPSERRAR